MTDSRYSDADIAPDIYRTVDMVGHKVMARQAGRSSDGSWCPVGETIRGRLRNWNADGTVFVTVSDGDTSYGKVVRCLGEGMEFVA
jgi:hypothetical protein